METTINFRDVDLVSKNSGMHHHCPKNSTWGAWGLATEAVWIPCPGHTTVTATPTSRKSRKTLSTVPFVLRTRRISRKWKPVGRVPWMPSRALQVTRNSRSAAGLPWRAYSRLWSSGISRRRSAREITTTSTPTLSVCPSRTRLRRRDARRPFSSSIAGLLTWMTPSTISKSLEVCCCNYQFILTFWGKQRGYRPRQALRCSDMTLCSSLVSMRPPSITANTPKLTNNWPFLPHLGKIGVTKESETSTKSFSGRIGNQRRLKMTSLCFSYCLTQMG